MRSLMKIALGFMLLISAAAATGSNIDTSTSIYLEAIGNHITGGANLAQITNAQSYVEGCNNEVDQAMNFYADHNCLTNATSQTDLIQCGEMMGNASGSCNDLDQEIDFNAFCDKLTDSSLMQMGTQTGDAIGCKNEFNQYTQADANHSCLTAGSALSQMSNFDICANGSNNNVDQWLYQGANHNDLTAGSQLAQAASKMVDILGSNNYVEQINNSECANYNCLTMDSMLKQMINEDAEVTGSKNFVSQGYNDKIKTDAYCNDLTNASILQGIMSNAIVAGSDNSVDHEVTLKTAGNSITGGMISQMSIVNTND